jgi:hypothetical protein
LSPAPWSPAGPPAARTAPAVADETANVFLHADGAGHRAAARIDDEGPAGIVVPAGAPVPPLAAAGTTA